MSSVNCNVINCSHNDSGMCYANKIAVNGKNLIQVLILVVVPL